MKNKIMVLFSLVCYFNLLQGQDYWKPIVSGTKSNLYSVSFGDGQTGYICGSDSLLLKSTDGGKTWNKLGINGISFKFGGHDLIDVKFVSPLIGYMIQSDHKNPVYQGTLYKTTDGGQNWMPNSNVNIVPWKIFYFSEDNGYQIGSAYFQGKMVGKQVKGNWQNIHGFSWNANEFISAIDFYDTLTGIIGGDSGFVYRTFDGGITWDTVKAAKRNSILCLKYISRNKIMGGTSVTWNDGSILLSNDSGKSWIEVEKNDFSLEIPRVFEIIKSKRDSIIRVGSITLIMLPRINDYGFIGRLIGPDSFEIQRTKYPMNDVTMKNDSIAFSVGDSGTIMCNGFFETNSIAHTVRLVRASVFPNPAKQQLTIQCESDFAFQLFASDGKLMASGINCFNICQLNVSGYTEGIYILRIIYKNNQVENHKIVIQ